MLDDMLVIEREIKLKGSGEVQIFTLGDCHIGSAECDDDGLKQFIHRIEKQDNAYVVICGDVLDNATINSVSNSYSATLSPQGQVDLATDLLLPIKDKILAMVPGNHENRTAKQCDINPLFVVACRLGLETVYRQNMAFVKLTLKSGKCRTTYTIATTHGKSDCKRKKFQLALAGIDVFISGHTHQPLIEQPSRLQFDRHNGTVHVETTVSIVTQSYLKFGGYGMAGLYLPNQPATDNPQSVILQHKNTNSNSLDNKRKITVIWG